MPFELNIRVAPILPTHSWYNNEPEREWRAYAPGNVVSVKPFGWSLGPHWAESAYNFAGSNKDAGHFVCVVVSDGPEPDAIAGVIDKEWRDDFEFTINAQYPATGRYNVTVRNANVSVSRKHALAQAKIATWLLGWGCSSVTYSANAATFDIKLWDAIRSWRFWGTELIDSLVNFSLVSYSAVTGIGRINIEIKNPNIKPEMVTQRIAERGGTLISSVHPNYVAEFERSDIYSRFKEEVKRFGQQPLRRRRYRLTDKFVNLICADAMANAGRAEYTFAELQAALLDGMAE